MDNEKLDAELRFEKICKGYEKIIDILTNKNISIELQDLHPIGNSLPIK